MRKIPKKIMFINPFFIGDTVLLEAIASKFVAENTEAGIVSEYPDLLIGHPTIKGYSFEDNPIDETTEIIDMKNSISGVYKKYGKVEVSPNKLSNMFDEAGVINDGSKPRLYLTEKEQKQVSEIKKTYGGKSVGVVMESRNPYKNWEYMELLIRYLVTKYHVYIIGQDVIEKFEYLRYLNVNIIDEKSLRELMVYIASMDMIVGPDTGPLHIAGALNIPITVIGFSAWKELYSLYENCNYLASEKLESISVHKVSKTCDRSLKTINRKKKDRIAIMLLEGLGGTITLSDHAKKVYDKFGEKPYLIVRKYAELFEDNPYVADVVPIGMKFFHNALADVLMDFSTVAGIKTGIGKWFCEKGKIKQVFRQWKDIWERHPIGSRELAKYGLNHVQTANMTLGLPYDTIDSKVYKYEEFPMQLPKRYMVISNGVDTWHKGLRQTKSWGHDQWERLVSYLNVPVIQVGTEFDEYVDGCIDLRQQTTIKQLLAILRDATAIICQEGGLMHLAYAVGNKNVFVIKGPTRGCFYAYPNQVNIEPSVCEACYWDTGEWYRDCPKGLDHLCMNSISPERVYSITKGVLGETLAEMQDPTFLQLDYGLFRTSQIAFQVDASV